MGPSPWQGSAIGSIRGLDISPRPTDSSSCSPPHMLWARIPDRPFSTGNRSNASARILSTSALLLRTQAPRLRTSSTVMYGNSRLRRRCNHRRSQPRTPPRRGSSDDKGDDGKGHPGRARRATNRGRSGTPDWAVGGVPTVLQFHPGPGKVAPCQYVAGAGARFERSSSGGRP